MQESSRRSGARLLVRGDKWYGEFLGGSSYCKLMGLKAQCLKDSRQRKWANKVLVGRQSLISVQGHAKSRKRWCGTG